MSAHVDDLVGSVGQVGGFANLFDHSTAGKYRPIGDFCTSCVFSAAGGHCTQKVGVTKKQGIIRHVLYTPVVLVPSHHDSATAPNVRFFRLLVDIFGDNQI